MSRASDSRALRAHGPFTLLQHPLRRRAVTPALPVLRAIILFSALSAVVASFL